MPRKPMSGPKLGALTEELFVGNLLRVLPKELVLEALKQTETSSIRIRLLPAHLVVYLVVAMGLFSHVSISEVMRILLNNIGLRFGMGSVKVPVPGTISAARVRLGWKPFAWLFDRVAVPLVQPEQRHLFWKDWRLVAIDGSSVEAQCTEGNSEHFGRPGSPRGVAGYPQVKLVVLVECATRAVIGWTHDVSNAHEPILAEALWPRLRSDMLMLADRAYYSYHRWRDCAARCGALLWRVRNDLKPERLKTLGDGSYLARIRPSEKLSAKGLADLGESMIVRVVEYYPVLADGTNGEKMRLFSTILDPAVATANELASLYPARWSVETGLDELKTHLRGPDRVLRSQRPDLVIQELYGFFLAHYMVRATMYEAACRDGCTPTELSFIHAVNVIRRQQTDFPPSHQVGKSAL